MPLTIPKSKIRSPAFKRPLISRARRATGWGASALRQIYEDIVAKDGAGDPKSLRLRITRMQALAQRYDHGPYRAALLPVPGDTQLLVFRDRTALIAKIERVVPGQNSPDDIFDIQTTVFVIPATFQPIDSPHFFMQVENFPDRNRLLLSSGRSLTHWVDIEGPDRVRLPRFNHEFRAWLLQEYKAEIDGWMDILDKVAAENSVSNEPQWPAALLDPVIDISRADLKQHWSDLDAIAEYIASTRSVSLPFSFALKRGPLYQDGTRYEQSIVYSDRSNDEAIVDLIRQLLESSAIHAPMNEWIKLRPVQPSASGLSSRQDGIATQTIGQKASNHRLLHLGARFSQHHS